MRNTLVSLVLLACVAGVSGGCVVRAEPAYPAYPVGYYYDRPYYGYYHEYHPGGYWYYDGRGWGPRAYVPGAVVIGPRYGRYWGRR